MINKFLKSQTFSDALSGKPSSLKQDTDYVIILHGIAAIEPLGWMIMPKPNDGKVSVASTRLRGMKDHIVVRTSHTFSPLNRYVQTQVLYFLQHGNFKR